MCNGEDQVLDDLIILSLSSFVKSAFAAASLAASRWRNLAVAGGPVVLMWCSVLCLAGGNLPSALATSWNWLKICLKAGGFASTAAKRPLLDCWTAAARRLPQLARLRTCAVSWCPAAGSPPGLSPGENVLKNLHPKVQNQPLLREMSRQIFGLQNKSLTASPPQHGIAWLPGLLKGGPVGSAADE